MIPIDEAAVNAVAETPVQINGAEAVIATAHQQIGKPYEMGAEGPNKFDCSGLVWDCFNSNGLGNLIGGRRAIANWYYHWFYNNGLFTTHGYLAERGAIIFYGSQNDATHCGLWLNNNNEIISALVNPWGVSKTRMHLVEPNGNPLPIIGWGQPKY